MPKCHKINCLQKQILPILFQNNTERNKTRLKGYLWPRWNLQTESKQFKCKLKRRVSTRKKTRKLKKQAWRAHRMSYKRLPPKKAQKRANSRGNGRNRSSLDTRYHCCRRSFHLVVCTRSYISHYNSRCRACRWVNKHRWPSCHQSRADRQPTWNVYRQCSFGCCRKTREG